MRCVGSIWLKNVWTLSSEQPRKRSSGSPHPRCRCGSSCVFRGRPGGWRSRLSCYSTPGRDIAENGRSPHLLPKSFVWLSPKTFPGSKQPISEPGKSLPCIPKNYPRGAFHETAGNGIRISQPSLNQDLLCRRDPVERVHPGTAKILRAQIRA
jgi:hypothetical protein